MAREWDGLDGNAVNTRCPLHCRLRYGAAGDNPFGDPAATRDQVDWAGLPVNLDLAFSRENRDKVYVQHLMRKRGTQLWRWLQGGEQVCVCDMASDDRHLYPDGAESVSGR